MRQFLATASACALVAVTIGCQSQVLVSPASLRVALDDVSQDRSFVASSKFANYDRVRAQILGVNTRVGDRTLGPEEQPLPNEIATSAVMAKLVRAVDASLAGDEDRAEVSFSKDDLIEFASASVLVSSRFFDMKTSPETGDRALGDPDFARTLRHYLRKYADGSFVDRTGGKMAKPQLGANIGNDTITGLTTVVLEAIFDYAFETPIAIKTTTKTVKEEAWIPVDLGDNERRD